MWFKNVRLYNLLDGWEPGAAWLNENLSGFQFQPCGNLDHSRYGFVEPVEGAGLALECGATGCIMICARRQEKVLPASVVKDELAAKVAHIRQVECRAVGRKEREILKDEIIFSLLPKAFVKSSFDYAYIDPKTSMVVVNSSSAKRAEDLLSLLREALGSLRCLPVDVVNIPGQVMTHWVREGEASHNFELGVDVDLKAARSDGEARFKRVDLSGGDVINHIDNGFSVSKLSLVWRDSVAFSLDDSLAIRGIKFNDSVMERANDSSPESRQEQFAADFAVMAFELRAMIADIIESQGGLNLDC